jgi:hypothetical protein
LPKNDEQIKAVAKTMVIAVENLTDLPLITGKPNYS